MNKISVFLISLLFSLSLYAGSIEDLDKAYANAKRGMQYGLTNLKEKKSRDDYKLIEQDRLLAEVKIFKEIGGVKIESKGVYNGEEVTIVTYRSYESLVKDGLIDKNSDLIKE